MSPIGPGDADHPKMVQVVARKAHGPNEDDDHTMPKGKKGPPKVRRQAPPAKPKKPPGSPIAPKTPKAKSDGKPKSPPAHLKQKRMPQAKPTMPPGTSFEAQRRHQFIVPTLSKLKVTVAFEVPQLEIDLDKFLAISQIARNLSPSIYG